MYSRFVFIFFVTSLVFPSVYTTCRRQQFQCRDGSCIDFDGKCDGVVNCRDGSDETHALCRNMFCQYNWFRCTYGACVNGDSECDGVQDCADNSDELLPSCKNDTLISRGKFRCQSSGAISSVNLCDGVEDCPDGSDETITSCADNKCTDYLFQCAYGACVDRGSDCDGKQDCADGSDEDEELCGRREPSTGTTTKPTQPPSGNCILPPYPAHGTYIVANSPGSIPGESFANTQLNVTCDPGYSPVGGNVVTCFNGVWFGKAECARFCKLTKHPSVDYRCILTGENIEGFRRCNKFEPGGTTVRPDCKSPNYYHTGILPLMHCIDGSWDYVATCTPGSVKTGTNVTVIVQDTVVVYVSNFNYISKTTTTDTNYDISESDWRIGQSSNNVNRDDATDNIGDTNVNINIGNRSVVIHNDNKVYFNDDD